MESTAPAALTFPLHSRHLLVNGGIASNAVSLKTGQCWSWGHSFFPLQPWVPVQTWTSVLGGSIAGLDVLCLYESCHPVFIRTSLVPPASAHPETASRCYLGVDRPPGRGHSWPLLTQLLNCKTNSSSLGIINSGPSVYSTRLLSYFYSSS